MRGAPDPRAEKHRVGGPAGANYGAFKIPSRRGPDAFCVLLSAGGGWDHVSVSLPCRTPTWAEMCDLKDLFFGPEECVMQLHPPASENVNNHNFCLHMWRPQTASEMLRIRAEWQATGEPYPYPEDLAAPGPIPRPPAEMV